MQKTQGEPGDEDPPSFRSYAGDRAHPHALLGRSFISLDLVSSRS